MSSSCASWSPETLQVSLRRKCARASVSAATLLGGFQRCARSSLQVRDSTSMARSISGRLWVTTSKDPFFFSLFTKVGVLHSRFAHVLARALVGEQGFPPTDTEGPHSRCAVRPLMPTSASIPLHVCPRQGAGLSLHARTSNGTQSSLWLLSSSTCGRAIFSFVRNIDPKNGDNLSSARQKMFCMCLRSLIVLQRRQAAQ